MKISIVICTYNTCYMTKNLIDSINYYWKSKNLKEIIVMENGSPDESVDVLSKLPNVRMVRSTRNLGHGNACHIGIGLAKSNYVFCMDSDTFIFRHGLDDLVVDTFKSNPTIVAAGPISYLDKHGIVITEHTQRLGGRHNGMELKDGIPVIHGSSILINKKIYKEMVTNGHPPCEHHGQPWLSFFRGIYDRKLDNYIPMVRSEDKLYTNYDSPIYDYMHHIWGQTFKSRSKTMIERAVKKRNPSVNISDMFKFIPDPSLDGNETEKKARSQIPNFRVSPGFNGIVSIGDITSPEEVEKELTKTRI